MILHAVVLAAALVVDLVRTFVQVGAHLEATISGLVQVLDIGRVHALMEVVVREDDGAVRIIFFVVALMKVPAALCREPGFTVGALE